MTNLPDELVPDPVPWFCVGIERRGMLMIGDKFNEEAYVSVPIDSPFAVVNIEDCI